MLRCSLSVFVLVLGAAAAPQSCGRGGRGTQGQEIGTLVDLGYARYQGVQLAAGVNQYLGLRYAAPPLGDLRFRAPEDPPSNGTVQDASQVSTPPLGIR